MKQTNSTTNSLNNAIEALVASYTAGIKGSALVAESKMWARKTHIKAEIIQDGVRAALAARTTPAQAPKPLSEMAAAIREYNTGKVTFSEFVPVARPDTTGMMVPACPKCSGKMHPFYSKDGREFWGCDDRECRGIRRLVRPMTEEESEEKAYASYLSK